MKYANNKLRKPRSKAFYILALVSIVIFAAIAGSIGTRVWYQQQLRPVSNTERVEVVEIPEGATVQDIATTLEEKGLIRSSQAFIWYVRSNSLLDAMKAGTYELNAAKSTPDIITVLTEGKVLENAVTILPGKRLDQIKESLINVGFTAEDVDAALEPSQYKGHPALVAKPTDQSLEGYLYPETFNASSKTSAQDIIEKSLDELAEVLTPELIDAFQEQGLGIHEAVSLASIVEKEVRTADERKMVAGVFYNRLEQGMMLQSDPTYKYAAYLLGVPPSSAIDSPYNTYKYAGIPPGPISNMGRTSLEAIANPTKHDYLYFVAGDDGITRFSKTLAEHQELTKKYCIELCSSY
jgi:UPF0755 protein